MTITIVAVVKTSVVETAQDTRPSTERAVVREEWEEGEEGGLTETTETTEVEATGIETETG